MTQYDAIVIGAGHNGLAAAATLAGAGRKVVVLEKNTMPGGMAANTTIAPGFECPAMAHLLSNLDGAEIATLGLDGHGFSLAETDLPTVSLCPEGKHVVLESKGVRHSDGTPLVGEQEFLALRARLVRFAGKLAELKRRPPPGLSSIDLREALALGKLALGIRRMGKEDTREFLRVLLSNSYDTILDEVEDGPLAGAFALDSVLGGHIGPRSPGTVLTLMYRLANGGAKHLPRGGMGAVMCAFEASAKAAGAEIRYGAAVDRMLVEEDRTVGVVLADGTEISGAKVLSSLDPRTTMVLAGVEHFDAEMIRRARNIRAKGCTAKVNLALAAAPVFAGLSDELHRGRLVHAPSLADLEKAFNRAKYGELPTSPVFEATIPSLSDPGLVDGEGHVMSIVVQYVPYALKTGWTAESRDALADIVVDCLDQFAPGLKASVIARQVLSPVDIEAETGAPGGHWHHGEMIADQMLMLRPAPGIERYALPVEGLYLCGASTHPGGDVTGIPGCNAAKASLQAKMGRAAA
ncbi:phytoene desaturase family protein [Hwanghaeella sp.]|uniref:phytoene desaturase family protein n=1 Tax=Hwanghaeella sp. TaxID=2605943 RepID=UPI003CCBE7D0